MAKLRKFRNAGVVRAHRRYVLNIIIDRATDLLNIWFRRRQAMGLARSLERCGRTVDHVGDLISDGVAIARLRAELRRLVRLGRPAPYTWMFQHPSYVLNGIHLASARRSYRRQPLDDADSQALSEDSDGERQANARRWGRIVGGNVNDASDEDYHSDTTEEWSPDVLFYGCDPNDGRGPDPDGGAPPPAVSA